MTSCAAMQVFKQRVPLPCPLRRATWPEMAPRQTWPPVAEGVPSITMQVGTVAWLLLRHVSLSFPCILKKRVQIIRTEISWDKCTDLILSYVSWACVIWQRPAHCEFTMVTFAMFRQQAPSLSQPARIYGQLDTTPASYRSLMGGGAYNGGSHGMEHTILPTR